MKKPPYNDMQRRCGISWSRHSCTVAGRATHHTSPAGLSLIELLIASVLVGAAGALLVSGLVTANRGADRRITQILSTQLLASQLALLDDQIGPKTPTHGTLSSPLGECTWTLEWTQTSLTPLVQATLSLEQKDHQTSHVVTYRTFVQP